MKSHETTYHNEYSDNQLARLRKYANLTQKELGKKAGVSTRMIEKYEQGDKDLNHASAETVYKLSKALECDMEELINSNKITD